MTDTFATPEGLESLGKPLQVHPPEAGAGQTGYFSIAAVLAVLSALAGIGIVNPPQQNPPPEIVFTSLTIVFGVLALVSITIGLLDQNYTLILFPDGLARTGVGKPEVFLWNEITAIYEEIAPVAWTLRIVAHNGRTLKIDPAVKNGKELAQALQQKVLDRMLPPAVKAFENGETLTFGPLRINQTHIYHQNQRRLWEEIASLQLLYNAYTPSVHFEVKTFTDSLPWCILKTKDIPNLSVFQNLAERKKPFTR